MAQRQDLKVLDPKLRRLVHRLQVGDSQRLEQDAKRGFIAAAPFAATAPETAAAPATLSKRVLVKLAGDRVPAVLAHLAWTPLVDDIYSVNVPLDELRTLAATPEVVYVSAGHVMTSDLITSLPETRATLVHPPAGVPPFTGKGVVIGIIDEGCDYALDDFRRSPGGPTRIAFLWDQRLTPTGNERSPAGFTHGVEYTSADIDAALTAPAGTPSLARHQFAAGSHGTHVMGIAAGNGTSSDAMFPAGAFIGAAPEATIIFVQPDYTELKSRQTTVTDSVRVAEAVTYIFQKAAALGCPCVVNMSLGQNGGSHDGESLVERTIDGLLAKRGRALVVAVGNDQTLSRHASGTLARGESRILGWWVGFQGLDAYPNEMEIWYPSRDRFSVRVIDPFGQSTPLVRSDGEPVDHGFATGNRAFIESERFTILNGDARISLEISPGTAPFMTTGVWKVHLIAEESRDGRFDAWIERKDAYRSVFDPADFDPMKTLGTPSTARRPIAVANYNHVLPWKPIALSSSHGPTRDGRYKPDVAAPGEGIWSANSLGGARPTGVLPVRIPMSGTSMAAPHVAGIVALMLECNPELTASQIGRILTATAHPPSAFLSASFSDAYGFGLVDALAAVSAAGVIRRSG